MNEWRRPGVARVWVWVRVCVGGGGGEFSSSLMESLIGDIDGWSNVVNE